MTYRLIPGASALLKNAITEKEVTQCNRSTTQTVFNLDTLDAVFVSLKMSTT